MSKGSGSTTALLTSTDAATTWRNISIDPSIELTFGSVNCHDSNSGGICIADSSFSPFLFISRDGGINWYKQIVPGAELGYELVSCTGSTTNTAICLAGANPRGSIAVSRDGGETWTSNELSSEAGAITGLNAA